MSHSGDTEEMEVINSEVPQNMPLNTEQEPNSAGGFTWKVDDMNRLRRFLCLGCEGGTYYTSQKELGIQNAQCIDRLIKEGKGGIVVEEIVTYSVEGRAAKQDPILFALAMCARLSDEKTKRAAYESVNKVCRIPTHLFAFIAFCEALSKGTGWGRAHRRAICNWYTQFADHPDRLAMHVTKYKNRNGWTHKDVLRLAHLKPTSPAVGAILRYVVKGYNPAKNDYLIDGAGEDVKKIFTFLEAVTKIIIETDEVEAINLIAAHGLVREHLPTQLLNFVGIWRSMLHHMPMTAMMRNLGKMSQLEMFPENSSELEMVMNRFRDEKILRKARIHPFNVLVALNTYKKGKGDKGKLQWPVSDGIMSAMDDAFYMSFKFVEPTNLRYCLALDVSGSMSYAPMLGCSSLTPRDGAAAMAMVTLKIEPNCEILAFSDTLVDLAITKDMKMEEVTTVMYDLPFGGTDCSLPMEWAMEGNKLIDVFIVYTDSETWFGKIHPAEALRNYRRQSGIWNAKLIVVAMTSSHFTIADPEDPGMMDMAGFDSAAPQVIRDFSLGML